MQFTTCETCHHPFPIFRGKPTTCPPCRKRAKGIRLTKSDLAFEEIHAHYDEHAESLNTEIVRLMRKNEDLARLAQRERSTESDVEEVSKLRRINGNLRRLLAEKVREVRTLQIELRGALQRIRELARNVTVFRNVSFNLDGQRRGLELPEDVTVKDLIRLTHPDRHQNSDVSNKVTKWLLEQRKEK